MLSSRLCFVGTVLLTVWPCVELRRCPQESLSIAAFIPCTNAADARDGLRGDYKFMYSATQLAADHLNAHSSLLANVTVNITALNGRDTVPILESIGSAAQGDIHGSIGPQDLTNSYLFTPVITNRLQIPSVTYILPEEDIVESRLYYRTLPSTSYIVDALVSLLDHFQWYRIAVLSTGEDEQLMRYEKFMTAFSSYLKEETEDLVSISFVESFSTEGQLSHSIEHLKSSDIKIVVAFVGERYAARMLCKASQTGLTTSEYAWILPSYTDPDWWKKPRNSSQSDESRLHNCTDDELKQALESTLFVAPTKYPPFTQAVPTYSPEEFREELLRVTEATFNTSNQSHLLAQSNAISAYDAVWTIASAWDSVIREENCENSTHLVMEKLKDALDKISKLEFQHLWNRNDACVFDDRKNDSRRYYGQVVITQFQDGWVCPVGIALPHKRSSGKTLVVLDNTDSHTCPTVVQLGEWIRNFSDPSATNCKFNFKWKDGETTPPDSGFSVDHSEIPVIVLVLLCVVTVAIVSLIISIAIFNLIHRENKFIKCTSPKVSIGVIIGLLLPLPVPILLSLLFSAHSYGLSGITADCLCWFRLLHDMGACPLVSTGVSIFQFIYWLPFFGLSLLSSTLLAKNYRIYRIFYNKRMKTKQGNRLTDRGLLICILLSLVPPLIFCIISTITTRVKHSDVAIPLTEDEYSFQYISVSFCQKEYNALIISLLVYLNIIIIPTILLACFTMRIQSRFGNDGRATSATVLALFVGGWIFALVQDKIDPMNDPDGYVKAFYFIVSYIILETLIPLSFLYLPLYYHMYKAYRQDCVSNNLKLESQYSKRVEYYHHLREQAADLKKQLDEVEKKLNELRDKRCVEFQKRVEI